MKLYICKFCYRIIGCQKEEDEGKRCQDCEFYLFNQTPCEEYLNTTAVFMDCECEECLERRQMRDN